MIKSIQLGDAIRKFINFHEYDFVHGCNVFCKMKRGIAAQVVTDLPALCEADKKTIPGDYSKLGTWSYVDYGEKRAYNLYSQSTYWDPKDMLKMDKFQLGMESLIEDMYIRDRSHLVMPMIGAGLARGTPTEILEMLDKLPSRVWIDLIIWEKETNPELLSLITTG